MNYDTFANREAPKPTILRKSIACLSDLQPAQPVLWKSDMNRVIGVPSVTNADYCAPKPVRHHHAAQGVATRLGGESHDRETGSAHHHHWRRASLADRAGGT